MNLIRRHFGLRWKSHRPNVDELLDMLDNTIKFALVIGIIFSAYFLVSVIERVGEERVKTAQAMAIVEDCMASRATFVINGQGARCKLEWIKVTP